MTTNLPFNILSTLCVPRYLYSVTQLIYIDILEMVHQLKEEQAEETYQLLY